MVAGTGAVTMTEDEWDSAYGGAINELPLHLDADHLAAIMEGHVWTQCEDGGGQGWLINGAFLGKASALWPVAVNVVGYWLSLKPWGTKHTPGHIHASWGGDLENPEHDRAEDE